MKRLITRIQTPSVYDSIYWKTSPGATVGATAFISITQRAFIELFSRRNEVGKEVLVAKTIERKEQKVCRDSKQDNDNIQGRTGRKYAPTQTRISRESKAEYAASGKAVFVAFPKSFKQRRC